MKTLCLLTCLFLAGCATRAPLATRPADIAPIQSGVRTVSDTAQKIKLSAERFHAKTQKGQSVTEADTVTLLNLANAATAQIAQLQQTVDQQTTANARFVAEAERVNGAMIETNKALASTGRAKTRWLCVGFAVLLVFQMGKVAGPKLIDVATAAGGPVATGAVWLIHRTPAGATVSTFVANVSGLAFAVVYSLVSLAVLQFSNIFT